MSDTQQDFSRLGFTKTFVLPAMLILLVPVISFLFFHHAQSRFDRDLRQSVLSQLRSDQDMSPEEREEAIAFYTQVPFSQLLLVEEFAANVDADLRWHYATFRWAIRLSALSILGSIAVFVLAGVCVVLSLRSQWTQYLSLSVGWHVLRIFGALQVLIQGGLLVALSFWITALWFEFYSIRLIAIIGLLVLGGVGAVIVAIFKRPRTDFVVEGKVIRSDTQIPLWDELRAICAKVGTAPPDQVIAGIDDNFFVTEHPVIVDGKTYRGRTLFVSLSLLKQLQGTEADAVLAHEMAHLSGHDTLYSKRISPLLVRYTHYLEGLYQGVFTKPIFYFVHCFRALFELSLGRLSRQREFRADRIAVNTTSPQDMAGALLRTVAYSKYRGSVENDLFEQEQVLEAANVFERIDKGFCDYADRFASEADIGDLESAHPFDSHPPLSQRLEAVEVQLGADSTQALLKTAGDGRWFERIREAESMEREQWREFEERFREYHEQTLPYRFLPETEEEKGIVVKAFPELSFEGKEGELVIDYEKICFPKWSGPLLFSQVSSCLIEENGALLFKYGHAGTGTRRITVKKFGARKQEVLDAINHYYGRYLAAVEYQKLKQAAED